MSGAGGSFGTARLGGITSMPPTGMDGQYDPSRYNMTAAPRPSELERLEVAVGVLTDALVALNDRLSPLMRPAGPTPAKDKSPEFLGSNTAARLDRLVFQVSLSSEFVLECRDRIDV